MVMIIKMTTHTDIDDMVMIIVMIIPTDTDGNTTTKVNLIMIGAPFDQYFDHSEDDLMIAKVLIIWHWQWYKNDDKMIETYGEICKDIPWTVLGWLN